MNLNYEEHCGYVNFLVESNWSLKKNRKTVHHVCFQRNQPFTFKGGGRGKERGGEKASCPQHSSDAEVFQETICIFLFHTALLVTIMWYVPSLVLLSNIIPLEINK